MPLSYRLRVRFISLLCGLAGHPTEPLICPFHAEGIFISVTCVCGEYFEHRA